MEKKVNYHFLTASTSYYNENSFQELIDEQKRFGGYVYWHIGNHKIKPDDICLYSIYKCNKTLKLPGHQ